MDIKQKIQEQLELLLGCVRRDAEFDFISAKIQVLLTVYSSGVFSYFSNYVPADPE